MMHPEMNGHMSPKQPQAGTGAAQQGVPMGSSSVLTGVPVMATPVGATPGVVVGQPVNGAAAMAGPAPANQEVLHGVPVVGSSPGFASSTPLPRRLNLRYGSKGLPRGMENAEGVPVMVPGNWIAQQPMRRTKLGVPKPRKEAKFETVEGPGGILTSGHGAVSAGPHHNPKGWKGLAAGAVSSLFIGDPLLLGPLIGYGVCKKLDRKQNTVGMFDQRGQVVQVKLWKAGKHAPLTEAGYWLVVSDPRDSEMDLFVARVLMSLGRPVPETALGVASLRALARRHSGAEGVSSLAQLLEDLNNEPWAVFVELPQPAMVAPASGAGAGHQESQQPPVQAAPRTRSDEDRQREAWTGGPTGPSFVRQTKTTSYQQFADEE